MKQCKKRYYYLDNIKLIMTVLVIFHHAASIVASGPFPLNLPSVTQMDCYYQYDILAFFQFANRGCLMGIFFFIAAYFVPQSYEKRGWKNFFGSKLRRLGIPVILSVLIIDPIEFYLSGEIGFFQSLQHCYCSYAETMKTLNISLGVTWFCWALIVFDAGYIVYRLSGLPERCVNHAKRKLPSFFAIVLFAIIMIPAWYIGLFLRKSLGGEFLGFHLLEYFPVYVAMYCFGIKAYNNDWIEQLTRRQSFIWGAIWGAAVLFHVVSFEAIGMSIFLIYTFKKMFDKQGKFMRLLTRSAYAAYIIQGIPLCFFGRQFMPYMTQFPLLNFVIIGIPALLVSFVLGYFMCKLPMLKMVV